VFTGRRQRPYLWMVKRYLQCIPLNTARQHGPGSEVAWTGARVHGPCEHVFYVAIAVPPLSSSSTSSSVDNDLDSDVKGAFTVSSQLTPSRLL